MNDNDNIKDVLRSFLISKDPKFRFFGDILMSINIVENNSIPTLAVGIDEKTKSTSLMYNAEFTQSLSFKELSYVLAHELFHLALNHIERGTFLEKDLGVSHDKCNVAFDLAINSILGEPPLELLYPTMFKDNIGNTFPLNKTGEEYILLLDNEKNIEVEAEVPDQLDGDQESNGSGKGDSKKGNGKSKAKVKTQNPKDSQEKGKNKLPNVSIKGRVKGKLLNRHAWDEIKNSPEFKKIQNIIQEILSRHKGELPSDVSELIEASFKPQINWKIRVRDTIHSYIRDYRWIPNYGRQNRRFPDKIGIVPGKQHKQKAKILIFIDTSGSISSKELSDAFSFSLSLPYDKEIYMIDAEIQNSKPIKIHGIKPTISVKAKGRGGTSFIPAFELAKEKKANLVVYFTDLYGNFPNPKDVKGIDTYWIAFDKDNLKAPFGKVIYAYT